MEESPTDSTTDGPVVTRRSTLAGLLGAGGSSFLPGQTSLAQTEWDNQVVPLFQSPVQGGGITPDQGGFDFPDLVPPHGTGVIPFDRFQFGEKVETLVSISGAVTFYDACNGAIRLYDLTNDTALEETMATVSRQNAQNWPQPFEEEHSPTEVRPHVLFSSPLQAYESDSPVHLAYQGRVNSGSIGTFSLSINVWGRLMK